MSETIRESLPVLFHRALSAAARASNLPTIEDATQGILTTAYSDLTLVRQRVAALSLFSSNETVADISSRNLVYLFVPYALAEVENRMRTTNPRERLERIGRAQTLLREFISRLEAYHIMSEKEKSLYEQKASDIKDPTKRREFKIKQYKAEKELKGRIEALQKRRHQIPATSEPSSDLELIASLLPSQMSAGTADEEDSDTEDILRETALLLLNLTYGQAQGQLESAEQELELLHNIPPSPSPQEDIRTGKVKEEDDMWKLDHPAPSGGPDNKGPLLDSSGKPLRPFTILPAGSTDRARLQAQVFRPDHRLPTMTVDEYLEIERQRGNIITGGGPQSEAKLTTDEQLQLDSEMDGTAFALPRAEEKRQKDEKWAQYKDTHPRGAGNTMNRG
ncbi:hypothetical protein NM688_g2349 [Phlebia brevispora]|uniref:Uncharacterized protein n=1 Tax=Phlebia brevispora TaxID=194682 RepID=A0ACC1T978_9APHY|nr:hypothetical protein NM688_g2349 [Phlebia brevispora]